MSNVIITKSDIKKFVNLFRIGLKSNGDKDMSIETAIHDGHQHNGHFFVVGAQEEGDEEEEKRCYITLSFRFSISKRNAEIIKELDAKDHEIEAATEILTQL